MLAPRSSIYWITLQHSESLHDWNMEITKYLVQWYARNLGSKKSYSKLLAKLLFINEHWYVLFSQFITCPRLNFQVIRCLVYFLENILSKTNKKTKQKNTLKKNKLSNKLLLYRPCKRERFATKKRNASFANEVW